MRPGALDREFRKSRLRRGIVWDMTQKPGLLGAIVAAVIGLVAGAAIALQFAKLPAAETPPVPAE